MIIVCRSPNENYPFCLAKFLERDHAKKSISARILLTADFNYPEINWESHHAKTSDVHPALLFLEGVCLFIILFLFNFTLASNMNLPETNLNRIKGANDCYCQNISKNLQDTNRIKHLAAWTSYLLTMKLHFKTHI